MDAGGAKPELNPVNQRIKDEGKARAAKQDDPFKGSVADRRIVEQALLREAGAIDAMAAAARKASAEGDPLRAQLLQRKSENAAMRFLARNEINIDINDLDASVPEILAGNFSWSRLGSRRRWPWSGNHVQP